MLYLHPQSGKIIKAKEEFFLGMLAFILKRIDDIPKIKNINASFVKDFFDNNINYELDNILIGDPNKLWEVNKMMNPFIQASKDLGKGVQYVFNYDLFTKKSGSRYDAYNLSEQLGINTCTYCNRNYTNTIITKSKRKITRPEFDHFFDKASNPLLAISFYNLIPSCSICNSSIKGSASMDLTKHLHPYVDDTISDIRFTYKYSTDLLNDLKIKIEAPNSSKAKNTVSVFALEEIYNSHTSELLDLINIREYFSDKYLTILKSNLLKNVVVSQKDLYRIVFGTEYDSKDFINKPFSKFKSDILKELGVI